MYQFDLTVADDLKVLGISNSLENANRHIPQWSEMALKCLITYLMLSPDKPFLAEEVRLYAQANGLEKPPSDRAWGGVMVKAAKMGIIESLGYVKTSNPLSHRTPANLWKKLNQITV